MCRVQCMGDSEIYWEWADLWQEQGACHGESGKGEGGSTRVTMNRVHGSG